MTGREVYKNASQLTETSGCSVMLWLQDFFKMRLFLIKKSTNMPHLLYMGMRMYLIYLTHM